MNIQHTPGPPRTTNARSRRLAIATAISIATATAGAAGASADEVQLDNDILPSVGRELQQGLSTRVVPSAQFGFNLSEPNVNHQLRKSYTLHLIGAKSEPFRSAAVFAAQQFKTFGDVTITVADGISATPSRGPNGHMPADGEITLTVEDGACGSAGGCAGRSWTTLWPDNVSRIDSGWIMIPTSSGAYPAGLIRTIVAHELGHALGLGHFNEEYAGSPQYDPQRQVMNAAARNDGTDGQYRQGDQNGIWYLAPPLSQFALRDNNSPSAPNKPDKAFTFGGHRTDIPLKGDWDGDGVDTPGVFRTSGSGAPTFYLRNSNSASSGSISFQFPANSTDTPIVGDWDGDGIDTVGVRRGKMWYLRNSNSYGSPDIQFEISDVTFSAASPTDKIVVGDWNGDGIDTIGIRRGDQTNSGLRGSWWHLRSSNTGNSGYMSFMFGTSTDDPVVGDWNGNGTDTIGVKRGDQWILRNTNSSSPQVPEIVTPFGEASDRALVGDWDGDGDDTVGVYR